MHAGILGVLRSVASDSSVIGSKKLPAVAGQFPPSSLRFRPHGNSQWTIRIGDHYRALAHFDGEMFVWTWIGSHEKYNKF